MDYFETLAKWQQLSDTIKVLQDQERALREGIFNGTFPDPKEGVNSIELADGRVLKGTFKINRSVDQEAAAALPEEVRERFFRVKYDLRTTVYKDLSAAERKKLDRYITAKPGLPTLQIVPAKKKPEDVAP